MTRLTNQARPRRHLTPSNIYVCYNSHVKENREWRALRRRGAHRRLILQTEEGEETFTFYTFGENGDSHSKLAIAIVIIIAKKVLDSTAVGSRRPLNSMFTHLKISVHHSPVVHVIHGLQHLPDKMTGVFFRVTTFLNNSVEQLTSCHPTRIQSQRIILMKLPTLHEFKVATLIHVSHNNI